MVPSQWVIRGIDGERYVLAIALPIIFPDSGEDDPLMTWLYNHIHEGLCAEQSRTPKAPDSSFLTAQEFQQFVDENGGHVLTEFLETKVEEALGLINQKLPGNLCRVVTVDGQPSIEIPTGNGENYDHLVIRALESTISDPFTEPVDPTPDTDHLEKLFEGFKTIS